MTQVVADRFCFSLFGWCVKHTHINLYRGVEQSGSSAGSYPVGRRFKSYPRYKKQFVVPQERLSNYNKKTSGYHTARSFTAFKSPVSKPMANFLRFTVVYLTKSNKQKTFSVSIPDSRGEFQLKLPEDAVRIISSNVSTVYRFRKR